MNASDLLLNLLEEEEMGSYPTGSSEEDVMTGGEVEEHEILFWEEEFRDSSRFWVQRVLVPMIVFIGVLGNSITIYILTRRPMRSSTNVWVPFSMLHFICMALKTSFVFLSLTHSHLIVAIPGFSQPANLVTPFFIEHVNIQNELPIYWLQGDFKNSSVYLLTSIARIIWSKFHSFESKSSKDCDCDKNMCFL